MGLPIGGALGWLHTFHVQPGREVVTNIRVAFGSPVSLNGAAVTACLWSDPNQDGHPSDAQILASADAVITGANSGTPVLNLTFVEFDIPDTVAGLPGKSFFIGVVMQHQLEGQFPALIDRHPPAPGLGVQNSTFSGAGNLNPNALTNITDLGDTGSLRGNWRIRADAVPIPAPAGAAVILFRAALATPRRHGP